MMAIIMSSAPERDILLGLEPFRWSNDAVTNFGGVPGLGELLGGPAQREGGRELRPALRPRVVKRRLGLDHRGGLRVLQELARRVGGRGACLGNRHEPDPRAVIGGGAKP
jgi:hypothetical protein